MPPVSLSGDSMHGTLITVIVGNEVPVYYLFCFEEKLSVIFACGPALRQFFAYTSRVRSCLPTRNRQYPNQDFEKMRWRINIRDIFWYRQAPMTGGRVLDAAPTFQRLRTPPPDPGHSNVEKEKVKSSKLDVWERKLGNIFRFGKKKQVSSCLFIHCHRTNRCSRLQPQPRARRLPKDSREIQIPSHALGTTPLQICKRLTWAQEHSCSQALARHMERFSLQSMTRTLLKS